MRQKPKIRFKGFTDDWEQRKLLELGEIVTGSTPSTTKPEYYSEEGIPWVTPTDIVSCTISDTPRKLSEAGAKIGRVVPANTILCTCIASIGKNTLLTVKGSFNQQINGLTPYEENDAYFLLTESELWSNQMKRMAASGTMQIVNKTEFSELLTMVPKFEEQKKIGDFFSNLDNLITLHQRKYDSLTKYKESMLQKLFPMRGKKEPEIRFKGFSVPWTEYKLGELYTERNERGNNSLQILSVSIHSGVSDGQLDEVELGKTVKRSEDKSTYKHVYTGDLIFNMMRAWQGAIGVAKCEGMISPAYISAVPNEKVYPLFMDYALRRSETIAEINNLSYGIRDFRKRLYWTSFIHVNCMLPSVEEQKKIYEFLRRIDEYSSVLQRKCNELKTLKKYLLQNMFCE